MAQQYKVKQRGKLLEFLFSNLDGWSKKTIKQRLQGSSVAVNGQVTTKHDFILNVDDIVETQTYEGSFRSKVHSIDLVSGQGKMKMSFMRDSKFKTYMKQLEKIIQNPPE